jgi:outer membrane protein assembly factor BamB
MRFAGKLMSVGLFIAVAYGILLACEALWSACPDQSLPVLGLPWIYRVERPLTEGREGVFRARQSALRFWEEKKPAADAMDVGYSYDRIPNECFLAGFGGAMAVITFLRWPPAPLYRSKRPSRRSPRLPRGKVLSRILVLLVLGIGATLLQIPGYQYLPGGSLKVLLTVFLIVSGIQFLWSRYGSWRSPGATPLPGPAARQASWWNSWFLLGMAGTFLTAVHTSFLADLPFEDTVEYSTWFMTADICSLGLLAAVGILQPASLWRGIGCGLSVVTLGIFAVHGFSVPGVAAWWEKVRGGAFHVFGAVALAGCLWYFLQFLRVCRKNVQEHPLPSFSASSALLLVGLAFATSMNFFLPKAAWLRLVIAVERNTGVILWQTTCAAAEPSMINPLNSLATPTPATDGRSIYAHFGGVGACCLDDEGRIVWSYSDPVAVSTDGAGSSLRLWGSLVLLTYDVNQRSLTVALDKRTGLVRWQSERTRAIRSMTQEMSSYSTPIILEQGDTCQLVHHGWGYLCGYEPATGQELWHFPSPGKNIIVSPVVGGGLLIIGGGEGVGRCLLAVEVQREAGTWKAREMWRAKRNLPGTASPVVYGDYVYTVTRGGIASCQETRTGRVSWVERLPGQYDASVVAGDGKIYFCNTDGKTTIVAAGERRHILRRNELEEPVRASFAISGGNLFVRGERYLFCIGNAR